jgi:hypothetical protein
MTKLVIFGKLIRVQGFPASAGGGGAHAQGFSRSTFRETSLIINNT